MTKPAETHNKLASGFVHTVAKQTRTFPQLLQVTESILVAVMLILQRAHRFSPVAASEMVEHAVMRANERFAAMQKKK